MTNPAPVAPILTDAELVYIFDRYGGDMVNCARSIERNVCARLADQVAPATATEPADERATFEAAISGPPYECEVSRFPDDATRYAWPGSYRDRTIDLAWHIWQERAALAAPVHQVEAAGPAPCQRCKGIIVDCTGNDCDGTGQYQAHWGAAAPLPEPSAAASGPEVHPFASSKRFQAWARSRGYPYVETVRGGFERFNDIAVESWRAALAATVQAVPADLTALREFAEWCISTEFDSREKSSRACAALAAAPSPTPKETP